MVKDFWKDLEKGHRGEMIVMDYLIKKNPDKIVEWVGNDREYFHKGDVKMTDMEGNVWYFEVKNDSTICRSHNVLCEERVYFPDGIKQGNMYSEYTNYCVVSEEERKIYLIDFKVLKDIYKKVGSYRWLPWSNQGSEVYLVSLSDIDAAGGLKAIGNY